MALRALLLLVLLLPSACSYRPVGCGIAPLYCPDDMRPKAIAQGHWRVWFRLYDKATDDQVRTAMLALFHARQLTDQIDRKILAVCRDIAGPDSDRLELPDACDAAIRAVSEAGASNPLAAPSLAEPVSARCYASLTDVARCLTECDPSAKREETWVQCEEDGVVQRCNADMQCLCAPSADAAIASECAFPRAARWCTKPLSYEVATPGCRTTCDAMSLGSLACLPKAPGLVEVAVNPSRRQHLDAHAALLTELALTRRAHLKGVVSGLESLSKETRRIINLDSNKSALHRTLCVLVPLSQASDAAKETLVNLRKIDRLLELAGHPVHKAAMAPAAR